MSQPSDETVEFYNRNGDAYVNETLGVDMAALYRPFLAHLRAGGHILDAGCGSGRDAKEFARRGYRVTAIDASDEMARLASRVLGKPVDVLRLQDLAFEDRFDGIWACASLVHVPKREVDDVLVRLSRALKRGGVMYASFKLGDQEGVRGGRLFSDYTETSLLNVLARHPALEKIALWSTNDKRPDRSTEVWLNTLAQRR